jgi:hypothetical protein
VLLTTGILMAQDPVESRIAFLDQWCLDCHQGAAAKGGFRTEQLKDRPFADSDLALWLHVLKRVESDEMPPIGRKRSDPVERDKFLASLDDLLASALSNREFPPSPSGVRRLSRFEYVRTAQVLFDLAVDPSMLPEDDLAYGFDSVAEAVTFSPLHLDRYLSTAEWIAERAVETQDPNVIPKRVFEGESMECTLDRAQEGDVAALFSNGSVSTTLQILRGGTYEVVISAFGQRAGPDLPRMSLDVNGKRLKIFDVEHKRAEPGTYTFSTTLSPGALKLAVAFINDYYDPKNENPSERDRNLYIDQVVLLGPKEPPAMSAFQKRLDRRDSKSKDVRRRLSPVVKELISEVFRGPAGAEDVARFLELGHREIESGRSFLEAIQTILASALSSPRFLFRSEAATPGRTSGSPKPLPDAALAVRLSYFLQSAPPDEALRAAAAKGRLKDPAVLLAEADRLLHDEWGDALARNFAAQWLDLRSLAHAMPDPERFPGFDDDLRLALREESELLFLHVLRNGLAARELITADFTYLNRRLAEHYGITGSFTEKMVVTPVGSHRLQGLLGHGAMHAITSNPTRTSVVKRGKWVLENLLDAAPPPPPPGVDNLKEEEGPLTPSSMREQLERHRADPNCAVCHQRMDSLGFALEHYDPLGRRRLSEGGVPLDVSGELPGNRRISGPEELVDYVATGRAFLRSLSKKLFIHALGRKPTVTDELALEAMIRGFPRGDPSLKDLILGIVAMDAFRCRL